MSISKISKVLCLYLFVLAFTLLMHLNAYASPIGESHEISNTIFKEVGEFKWDEDYVLVDRITNDKNIISGKTIKNSILKFMINNVEYSVSSDNEGNFTLLIEEGLLVDVDQVNIKVYDYLGNQLSNLSLVVHDILPPIDPKINNVINNSDTVISGYGEPNSFIKVYIEDREFLGNVHSNGYFEIEVGDSLRSANTLRVISHDYFNNYSGLIEKQINDVLAPDKPNIVSVDTNNNYIFGHGEANCNVVVNLDGKTYKSYIDNDGCFYVYDEEGLLDSTEHIKVQVVDLSGNKSEEVFFEIDKQNVGSIALNSLDKESRVIKDAMIKLRGCDDMYKDEIFNLDDEGNLLINDIPYGDYELVIRYRTDENKIEENFLNISLDEENSEIEVLID